jgi:hypothetical protein
LIWGFEKPEVALTETFAVHNRRVADTNPVGGLIGGSGGNSDQDLDQVLRPQGSLFVELYRQGNPKRTYSANDVVEPDGKLDLAKKTSGGDYVWRLAIGKQTKDSAKFKWNQDDHHDKNMLYQLSQGQVFDGKDTERFIWFGKQLPATATIPNVEQCSFYNKNGNNDPLVINVNDYLVIAPRVSTSFASEITNGNNPPWGTHNSTAPNAKIDLTGKKTLIAENLIDVGVNVSEPLPVNSGGTWTDAYPAITATQDTPFDTGILSSRGTIPCYKTICLQRLADPNRKHHLVTNPYLTVDWNMIDLHVINSEEDKHPNSSSEETDSAFPRDGDMRFASRQWKKSVQDSTGVAKGFSNLWDRTLTSDELSDAKAGLEKNPPSYASAADLVPAHTFGQLNKFDGGISAETSPYQGTPAKPFLHFPWNDAPLTNTFELMLVPATAADRFGVEFHDNQTAKFFDSKNRFSDPYRTGSGLYMNFWDTAYQPADWAKIFDYVRVPSRFAGTIRGLDAQGQPFFEMREPGKININTLTEAGWKSLQGGHSDSLFVGYTDLQAKRTDAAGELKPLTLFDLIKQDVVKPDEKAGNPCTVMENLMRLSDVTTTRSNVFAVWITVGYFNLDSNRKLADERGLTDGTMKRHRAFYLIDRSVPVGFRRGEKLNSENIVIKKTVLE